MAASAATTIAQELREHELLEAHDQGLGRDLRIAVSEPDACIDRDRDGFSLLTFEARSPDEPCDPNYGRRGQHSTDVASALAEARPNEAGGVAARGPFAARVFDVD